MKYFFINIVQNILRIFSWPYILGHVAMVVLTYLLVANGLDWGYFLSTRLIPYWVWIPAGLVGGLLPILLPLLLLGFGRKNRRIANTAFALGQAAMLGWLISSTYKAFTGRIPPDLGNASSDITSGFQFGFWEGGIFWGWPSSHTTVAFAMAVAFIVLFPRHPAKWIILLYAAYIGFGASLGFHWLSESISGAILGSLVGYVVGISFVKRMIDAK